MVNVQTCVEMFYILILFVMIILVKFVTDRKYAYTEITRCMYVICNFLQLIDIIKLYFLKENMKN